MQSSKYSSYYFSKIDKDYNIKGSRDPLGFQVIWQHQGRQLIPYLSTVSFNLQDFQILCLAYYFYRREPDNAFVKFFLRFEQLMAYVRYKKNNQSGFNGIDRVRRNWSMQPERISVSNTSEDEILSNQRAYGIWGKYNRPFHEIGLHKDIQFNEIYENKWNAIQNAQKDRAGKILNKILEQAQLKCGPNDLDCLDSLLDITDKEREFFERTILKVNNETSPQNLLFSFLTSRNLSGDFSLYPFLMDFENFNEEEQIKCIIRDTVSTEMILSPLNRIFRYIQNMPLWDKSSIDKDSYIDRCKHQLDYEFYGDSDKVKYKNFLLQSLRKTNWDLMKDLVQRNSEVAAWRGGKPWLSVRKDMIEVHYAEGGFRQDNYDPLVDYDNDYFIRSYISLFRQTREK